MIDSGGVAVVVVENRDLLMITNGFRGRDGCKCNGLNNGRLCHPE